MIENDIKIYHVETQEDYNDLMIKLENEGYRWMSGDKPTTKPQYWNEMKENTVVSLNGFKKHRITKGSVSYHKKYHPNMLIIKHKTKESEGAGKMEKIVLPKFVAEYIENHYGTEPSIWDKADLIKDFDMYLECNGNPSLQKWVKDDDNFLTLITAIITNNYEVEEKQYYWRKKTEYCLNFEYEDSAFYINLHTYNNKVSFNDCKEIEPIRTKFTESEIMNLVSQEDFNKLEKVEIKE